MPNPREVSMRTAGVILCSALLISGVVASAEQDGPPKPRTPGKGDIIVVKGCLRGSLVESAETRHADEGIDFAGSRQYQLKGDKDLLKQLKSKYNRHRVEITGILRSYVEPEAARGKQIGPARVVIGVDSTARHDTLPPSPPLPILEVQSFEGYPDRCER
jgi:hypothetical protein